MKPYSPACERNREPILAVLHQIISPTHKRLLEIGSGTGQHAVYFAPSFPFLEWITSDVKAQHAGIRLWLDEASLPNVSGPLELDIGTSELPPGKLDVVFSANVLHIMSWEKGQLLFKMLGQALYSGAQVLFYGPFNYRGQYTSTSNREFDLWLKSRDQTSGIRNFEDVLSEMEAVGFKLQNDFEMPSNNRILHFAKS